MWLWVWVQRTRELSVFQKCPTRLFINLLLVFINSLANRPTNTAPKSVAQHLEFRVTNASLGRHLINYCETLRTGSIISPAMLFVSSVAVGWLPLLLLLLLRVLFSYCPWLVGPVAVFRGQLRSTAENGHKTSFREDFINAELDSLLLDYSMGISVPIRWVNNFLVSCVGDESEFHWFSNQNIHTSL